MKRAISSGPLRAFDEGTYHASVVFVQETESVRVGPSEQAPHGKYVALGTPRMKARPHHLKALEIVLPEIPGHVRVAIRKNLGAA